MPTKMIWKDDEGRVFLIIDKKILYSILIGIVITIILIVYLGIKIQYWFSIARLSCK